MKRIVDVLKSESQKECPKFKYCVEQRGFALINCGALGLKDVLCLPAKHKVITTFTLLLYS